MKSTRHAHRANGDAWNPHCRICGVQLLDGALTPAELCERVTAAFQQKINPTGRVRGSWLEVEEVLDNEVWCWWVRPASNLLGFEAIEHPAQNPTGEELSMAFLVEMLSAPDDDGSTKATVPLPEPAMPARARKGPSRWERFKRWSRANAEREFVTIGAPITCIWAVALGWVLGWDGMCALAGLLVGWMF
ncbi:hypothetical protein [Streptomyces europaeiscabiei]|uniref:hypothetical protein n=1 Tax=Streptomyces europaeiscabiei TaxID=146819 RepID=UPI0029BDCC59|nr:hypothetical protein [Streptomyces europaeiscabiei]MDX3666964.1 hypothetical protein [Streptomyces europaeiscabiei]